MSDNKQILYTGHSPDSVLFMSSLFFVRSCVCKHFTGAMPHIMSVSYK